MRFGIIFLPFLVFACAGQGTLSSAPPTPTPVQEAISQETPVSTGENLPELPPTPEAPTEPEETDKLSEGSQLQKSISNWIEENPNADFDEVARMANRFLRLHGYPMVIDASPLLKEGQTAVRIKSGKKTFVFEEGQELSRSTDLCGERFLRIPARILGADQAALVNKGKEYPISLHGFNRERFRVFRGRKLIAVIHAPEPTEPIGIGAGGKTIYMRFPLFEGPTAQWWQRIGVHQPSVLDEEPYLMLRVNRSRLYFDENIEHLPPQEFEVEDSDKSSYRWRFQPTGLVLELSSRCG